MSLTPPTGIYPVIVNNVMATRQEAYIQVRDSAGYPTNGNGMVVNYNEIQNGVTTAKVAIIPGQSLPLYFGTYNSTYGWVITSFKLNNQIDPPVNNCDLVINTIKIDKSASSVGASDGQITISAFSSYLPILYSINNTTWQLSPTFTGLPGGLITVYCKDSNAFGCSVSRSVTIPLIANLLISDPSVTINTNTCRWNAAFNPITFTYQRRDFEVTGAFIDTATGKPRIIVNAELGTVAAQLEGLYVYLNASPYIGTYKVLSADDSSLVIETPYSSGSDTVTGFVNINLLRPYYKIFTNIIYRDPITGSTNTIIATNRPDNQGIVRADISNFLQSILRAKDDSTYTATNFRDFNLSACYTIQYADNYDDGTTEGKTSDYINITAPYYVTYTARQLRSINGGNLAEYVPFPAPSTPAKWITDFAEPAYSNGLPFDMSFIYSETLAGRQLYYKMVLLDINRNPLPGGDSTSYLLNEDGSWLLNQDESKLVISSQTSASSPIPKQIGLNRLRINMDMPLDAWYFTIGIFYDDEDSNPIQVIQTQTIRIDHAPDINSVYMRWIGLTGSWNYYRFNYNQEISLDVQNATIIKNYVHDWQNQEGIEEVISKDAGQKIKLMAEDLSVADIKGLQSIKYSPKVQMLLSANPVQWQTVVLNTATFSEYETINGQAPFSITFNQPSINIQTQ